MYVNPHPPLHAISYTFDSRVGLFDDARKVFRDIASKNLDWPEAIWEAWIAFEHVYGTVEELEDSMDRIEKAQKQVAARRAKVHSSILQFWIHIDHKACV